MTRAILFDLDGTLIDSRADLATGVNLTRGDLGLAPLAPGVIAGFVGDGVRKLLTRALPECPERLEQALELAPAGTRAAQPRLADGTLLDDRVGYRFAVLALPHLIDGLSAAARARLAADDLVVVTAEGKAADYLADLDTGGVVIRPDRYILGTASTPAELDAVLAQRRWPVGSEETARRTQKVAAII